MLSTLLLLISTTFAGKNYTSAPVSIIEYPLTLEGGELIFRKRDNRIELYVSDYSGDTFTCKNYYKKSWLNFSEYFTYVSSEQSKDYRDADFNYAQRNLLFYLSAGQITPTFCDVTASISNSNTYLTFVYSDSCYGSAGCIFEYATFHVEPQDLAKMSSSIDSLLRIQH